MVLGKPNINYLWLGLCHLKCTAITEDRLLASFSTALSATLGKARELMEVANTSVRPFQRAENRLITLKRDLIMERSTATSITLHLQFQIWDLLGWRLPRLVLAVKRATLLHVVERHAGDSLARVAEILQVCWVNRSLLIVCGTCFKLIMTSN